MPLRADQRRQAKSLRERGFEWADVAAAIGRTEGDIRHALANARTPSPNPKRATLNVSLESYEAFLTKYRVPGEKVWETFNRLMGV